MKDSILSYIKDEYLDEDEASDMTLTETTPLISSGIIDSFSMVSLKLYVERTYEIRIPDAEATPQAFDTVASIVEIVNRHIAKKGA